MFDLLCLQVATTFFFQEGRTFFHFVRKSLDHQTILKWFKAYYIIYMTKHRFLSDDIAPQWKDIMRILVLWQCWPTWRLPTEEWFCIICSIWQWQLPDSRQHLHQFHLLSLCISTVHVCLHPSGSYYNHGICRDAERWGHQGCGPGLSKWVRQHTQTYSHARGKSKFTQVPYVEFSGTCALLGWFSCQ